MLAHDLNSKHGGCKHYHSCFVTVIVLDMISVQIITNLDLVI